MPKPLAPYALNFDKDADPVRDDRYVKSITFATSSATTQLVIAENERRPYVDKSVDESALISCVKGESVQVTFDRNGGWTNAYVYIDLDHSQQFSFREGDFDWIPLYADPMVAWLPPEHPLAGGRTFPLAAFATEPTIATYMHQDTDNARVFARAGITPNVRYTSVDSRATFAMVQAGLGVSLNNQLITRGWDTTGIVILPVDPPQYAEIGIAAPAPEELSPAAKRFLAFARQTLRTDPEAAELGKEQA